LAGCALFGRYAIGREYTLVGIRWGGLGAMECDRLYSLDRDTLFCKFDGAPQKGYPAISGIVPFPTGEMQVISADGMRTTKASTLRPFPVDVLRDCPLPQRHSYPVTVGQAVILQKWEECVSPKL